MYIVPESVWIQYKISMKSEVGAQRRREAGEREGGSI